MYQLCHDKEKCIIEVKKAPKVMLNVDIPEIGIKYHNSRMYLSNSRKELLQFARALKKEWLDQAAQRVADIENIEI
jgi:hypothetical protein